MSQSYKTNRRIDRMHDSSEMAGAILRDSLSKAVSWIGTILTISFFGVAVSVYGFIAGLVRGRAV